MDDTNRAHRSNGPLLTHLKRLALWVCVSLIAHFNLAYAKDWMDLATAASRRVFPEQAAELAHSQISFFWPVAPGATAYTLYLQGPTLQTRVRTATNYYVWPDVLPAGAYAWQVTAHFPNKAADSTARLFEIKDKASELGPTNVNQLVGLLTGQARPRFFPKGQEWRAISLSFSNERQALFNAIVKRASTNMTQRALPTALRLNTNATPVERLSIKRTATQLANGLEDTAFLWRVSKDDKWRVRAHDIVATLDSIDETTLYSDPYDLLSARNVLWARVIVYDWMFDAFDQQQRLVLQRQIEKGMLWLSAHLLDSKQGLGVSPYDSHGSEVIGAVLLSAANLLGVTATATSVFQNILPLYLASILPTLSSDGGAGTSGAYAVWDVGTSNIPHWDALRWSTGLNMAALTQVQRMSQWLVRAAPPATAAAWFGDGAEVLHRSEWEGVAHLLATRTSDPLLRWYVQRVGLPKNPTVWHLLAPGELNQRSVPNISPTPNFEVFPFSGLGILNVNLSDPGAASIHFRSSPFGSMGHAHYDQNSFVIAYKNRLLTIDSGAYDYWGSDQYFQWYKRTVAHNAITWDGGIGQEGTSKAIGRLEASGGIVTAGTKEGLPFITGDASAAYGPEVTRAARTIIYLPGDTIAVFDDIAASTPRRWEWNLHAMAAKLNDDQSVVITNGPARACIDFFSAQPTTSKILRRQSPPVDREWGMASHDHLTYSQAMPTNTAQFVALIRLDCKAQANTVVFEGGTTTLRLPSKTIRFDKQTVAVGN